MELYNFIMIVEIKHLPAVIVSEIVGFKNIVLEAKILTETSEVQHWVCVE